MRRILLCLSLALVLPLAACTAGTTAEKPGEDSAPVQAGTYEFHVLPVTQEGIRTLYGWEGHEVLAITEYEGDYLVEYGASGDRFSILDWVFSSTGRRVQLTAMTEFISYEITGPGQVHYTATGQDAAVPWNGMPSDVTVRVLGDANKVLLPGWVETETYEQTVWLDPAQPFSMGCSLDGQPVYSERYEQLYDARIDADGLSFSFIPNGDSPEKFHSFFPAVTTIPSFTTVFDPDSRQFTLRLYNTSLESGAGGNAPLSQEDPGYLNFSSILEEYGVSYPYSFPAGSLGRDSHFLRDVTIAQDGEDVVVSATLTDRAFRFTVETSNLGLDNIPCLRIQFREQNPDLDGQE